MEATCTATWRSDPGRVCGAPVVGAGESRCLAHHAQLAERLRNALTRSGRIELIGTEISAAVVSELRNVLTDARAPVELDCSNSSFVEATSFAAVSFPAGVCFADAVFADSADFAGCEFATRAEWTGTVFRHGACFAAARFDGPADFARVEFGFFDDPLVMPAYLEVPLEPGGGADGVVADMVVTDASGEMKAFRAAEPPPYRGDFSGARFGGTASFVGVKWHGPHRRWSLGPPQGRAADFSGAVFARQVHFGGGSTFAGGAEFDHTVFEDSVSFLGARHLGTPVFRRTRFAGTVVLAQHAGRQIVVEEVTWTGPGELDLNHAAVVLRRCVIGEPLTITQGRQFADRLQQQDWAATGLWPVHTAPSGRLVALDRCTLMAPVTIAGCSLADTSFLGSTGLELLRFPTSPDWRRLPLLPRSTRWLRPWWQVPHLLDPLPRHRRFRGRQVLADVSDHPEEVEVLYRQIRAGLEASKSHAAANDFYYGEMEARRRHAPRSSFEHWLLGAYRVVFGYGVRASRPFAWWLATVAVLTWLFTWRADQALTSAPAAPALEHWYQALAFVLQNSTNVLRAMDSGLQWDGTLLVLAGRLATITLLAGVFLALRSRVTR